MKITETNAITQQTIVRDATAEELTQFDADQAEHAAAKLEFHRKAEAKAALLDRLGITAEEAALLLG